MAMAPLGPDPGRDSASHFSTSHPKVTSLRNPLPLSAAQEAQVRDLYYKRVRSRCADEIKDFAACARGRTVSATWTCRTQRLAMNSCMVLHATPAEEDAAREEWFSNVTERRKKREQELVAVEKRREEVIELTRRQEEKELKEEAAKKKAADALSGKAAGEKEKEAKKGWWR